MTKKINNEIQLLELFIDPELNKEAVRKPFSNNGKICATDTRILIVIDEDVTTGQYEPQTLNIAKVIPNDNIKLEIKVSDLEATLSKLPQVPEEYLITPEVECTECDDMCEVDWEYTDKRGYTHREAFECPICKGTGIAARAVYGKTGNYIPDEEAIVKIQNGQKFLAQYLHKLLQAAKILGSDTILYTSQGKVRGNVFTFTGTFADAVKVVIMPNSNEADIMLYTKRLTKSK
ncbi:MAG: hypothetical protein NC044_05610 [Prevotella sp.]|nr:hypothetical protein [Bacteroides sp.]MCM1445864.1 hypothetical protein [Prevotella sp.]